RVQLLRSWNWARVSVDRPLPAAQLPGNHTADGVWLWEIGCGWSLRSSRHGSQLPSGRMSLVSCHPVGRDRRRHRQTVQEPPGAVAGGRREGGRGGGGGGREVASVPGSSTSKVCLQVGGVERLCRHSLWKPQHCCDLIETNNIFQFILSLLL
ncbi:hypothetical protein GBAR_LOCUS22305, partial [Geodia barretti]